MPADDLPGAVSFSSSHSTTPETSQHHTCARDGGKVLLKNNLSTCLSRLRRDVPQLGGSALTFSWILDTLLDLSSPSDAFWSKKALS